MEDNGLKELIDSNVPKSGSSNAALLDAWKNKTANTRIFLLEFVKDHIVSSLHVKATPFLMWKDLTDLFESRSAHRKLALKDKLKKNKNGEGRQYSKLPHEVCPLQG